MAQAGADHHLVQAFRFDGRLRRGGKAGVGWPQDQGSGGEGAQGAQGGRKLTVWHFFANKNDSQKVSGERPALGFAAALRVFASAIAPLG